MPLPSAQAAKTKRIGDVNADTEVGIADCVLLSRYVAKWNGVTVDKDTADLDRSGVIDTKDALILARYLANWEGYDKYICNIETDPLRIEAQPQAFAIDYGEDAKLSVTAAGGEAPYTYQWSRNGEDIEGAVGSVYTPSNGGNYRCVVTDSDGNIVNSKNVKCAIHPIIKTQPIDGADNFQVEVAGGTNLSYHWEKEVLDEWRVQRESYGSGYGATSVGNYRCIITDEDGYQLTSDVVRWYGSGELTVSNIHLSDAADANYGLTIDFTHQKIEHFRYPMLYWIDGVKHRVTMEEAVTGQYPENANFNYIGTPVYYDYNVPVCAPYAASGLYGDYLDLYVDATGEGPLYFDWQLAPSFEQALAGNFTSIKKDSGCLGLGTENLRFPMKENDDPVHCYGYVRCIVTDRNGESRISEFGNPWGFDHDTFITTPNLLEWAGGGPNNADYIKLGEVRHGGITSEAHFWYRDGAKELALWGCKAPTFKEMSEETVSGAELPLNPLADVPTAPIVDTDFSGEVIGTRDAMWNCGYLKLDEDGNPTNFAEVYTSTNEYQFENGHRPYEYKCCKYYDWQKLEEADTEIAPEIVPRSEVGSGKFEICRRDGTYLPAVELNLYQYNMHEPDCRKPHNMQIWFGEVVSPGYQAGISAGYSDALQYNLGHTYWWLEFAEPLYAPWYNNNVRYLYAYADHPVTVKNPESYTVVIDDIDLEQAESGDAKNIVKYLKGYSDKYKDLSAEEIKAMLPIKLSSGDCNGWCRYYCGGGIDQLLSLTGGNAYCICEYADGTSKYYGTPSEKGCTVKLTGMGTYTSVENIDGTIGVIFDLDDFSLETAKKSLPYTLKTGMASDEALRAADKMKKFGFEVTVTQKSY